jgi:hypothetical protein
VGKPQTPTTCKKSGKAKQNSKKELKRARKAQTQGKRSKLAQKLKINTPLKSTPPNPLNASSPP